VATGGALWVAGGASDGAVEGASVISVPADEQAARMSTRLPRIGRDAVRFMADLSCPARVELPDPVSHALGPGEARRGRVVLIRTQPLIDANC
jgi:hypothetical protein